MLFCRKKTLSAPRVVLSGVAVVAGLRPVCIQWRSVEVCDVMLVGTSMSIIRTAYVVPFSLCLVATVGCSCTAVHRTRLNLPAVRGTGHNRRTFSDGNDSILLRLAVERDNKLGVGGRLEARWGGGRGEGGSGQYSQELAQHGGWSEVLDNRLCNIVDLFIYIYICSLG